MKFGRKFLTNPDTCCIITGLAACAVRMEKSRSWPSAHDWKSCIPQKGIEGSNPSFSAIEPVSEGMPVFSFFSAFFRHFPEKTGAFERKACFYILAKRKTEIASGFRNIANCIWSGDGVYWMPLEGTGVFRGTPLWRQCLLFLEGFWETEAPFEQGER